jgi:cell division septation protein DedD
MATAQQDTEITLGTGRMLGIFFAFVVVCAFFFGIGFSLGRKTTLSAATVWPSGASATPATVVRPSAVKNNSPQPAPQSSSGDFGFYKAVGEKNADTVLTPADTTTQNPKGQAPASAASPAETAPETASGSGYFVQVAAVSRKEDAEALVEALKKKQYPAFTANNPSIDKFFHVQVGPYAEMKDAEALRARLIGDGYNPIVKK